MMEGSKGSMWGTSMSLEQNGSEQHNPNCQREAFSSWCHGDALDGRWSSPVMAIHACCMQVGKETTHTRLLFAFLPFRKVNLTDFKPNTNLCDGSEFPMKMTIFTRL